MDKAGDELKIFQAAALIIICLGCNPNRSIFDLNQFA